MLQPATSEAAADPPGDPAEHGVAALHDSHALRLPRAEPGETLGRIETYLAISGLERRSAGERAKPYDAVALGAALTGARVLDAGAGQGAHALALAGRYSVLGVDASPQLVGVARRRSGPLGPRFVCADLGETRLPERRFDVALSLNTSIGYGGKTADAAALESIARALRPGARLVLETHSTETAERAAPIVHRLGGAVVETDPAFDEAAQRLTERQGLRLRGRVERRSPTGFAHTIPESSPTCSARRGSRPCGCTARSTLAPGAKEAASSPWPGQPSRSNPAAAAPDAARARPLPAHAAGLG